MEILERVGPTSVIFSCVSLTMSINISFSKIVSSKFLEMREWDLQVHPLQYEQK